MANLTAAQLRELQARTGASLADCRRALTDSDGDVDRATALLLAALEEQADDDDDADPGSLKNQFLIAMPSLDDENFGHTVSLLCEHNDNGAVALVINRPTDLKLSEMMDQMGLPHEALNDETIVYWGGPVQPERGFVIHRAPGGWESCLQVDADLYITTSRDILRAIGKGAGPKEFFVVLGYAGWGAGQLETEILRNSWLNTPVDRTVLFAMPPAARWEAATRLLGIDVTQIAGDAGHA